MSLSPVKHEILESMFLCETPQKAMDIAKASKKEFQPVMMHLLGLVKMGYVTSPQKGLYVITAQGKHALGVAETSKEKAVVILTYSPHDKAFNFYAAIDKPLGIHAHSLRDFAAKINKVDADALQFHLERGDFAAWFRGLCDEELAKKAALLKAKNVQGEELRRLLHGMTQQRYLELAKLAGVSAPTE
jgi:hypothetical protein